jgi:predicted RNA-binding protein YlxR (DUF448 family)
LARDRRKRAGRRAGPFRTCLGCRKRRPIGETLRLVLGPQGQVLPDLYAKLPGRGAHVCPDLACLELAQKRQAFARAFRAEVRSVDPLLLGLSFVRSGLRQIQAVLATAARTSRLLAGRTEVLQALSHRGLALVVLAEDGSESLQQLVEEQSLRTKAPCRCILTKQDLARFRNGKPLAVVGVAHRGLAARILEEIDRTSPLLESVRNRGDTALGELTAG